jgi:hypothetical protein
MMNTRHRVLRGLAVIWLLASAVLLAGITIHIFGEPGFPLGLGLIQTRGLPGLWATLVPATIGLTGLMLIRRANRLGAGLLLVYSAFWGLILGSLAAILWSRSWVPQLVVLGLLAPFVLIGVWSWRVLTCGSDGRRDDWHA